MKLESTAQNIAVIEKNMQGKINTIYSLTQQQEHPYNAGI